MRTSRNIEEQSVEKTDGGFWRLFKIHAATLLILGMACWFYGTIWIKVATIIIILLLLTYDYICMRRSEENEFAVQTRNGKFTKKYYGPGDNHVPFSGLLYGTVAYQTGRFMLEIQFKELTLPSTDNAAGTVKLTCQIKPEDCERLYILTRGTMDHETIKKETAAKLATTISQALGSSITNQALGIKIEDGSTFEQVINSGKMSNFIGKYLTSHESEDYAKGLKPKDYALVETIGLHLTQVEFSNIVITGAVFEAKQKAEQQKGLTSIEVEKQNTSKAKQAQLDQMVENALDAAIKRKKKYTNNQSAALSEAEMQKVYTDTVKTFRQQNGADMLILEQDGNNSFNSGEFAARYAASSTSKKQGGKS